METGKYNLNISVRKGLEDMHIQTIEIDLQHFKEILQIRALSVFDKDAYITASLDKVEVDKDTK